MKKYLCALAVLFILALTVSSCDLNNDFEDVQVEEIQEQESSTSTGNTQGSGGQNPPWGS